GKTEELIYQKLVGLDVSGSVAAADTSANVDADADADAHAHVDPDSAPAGSGDHADDDSVSDGQSDDGTKEETKDEKRERQKAVKEANRERRKTKVPKFVKKRATRPKKPSKRSSGRSPERPSQRERDGRGRPRAVVSYGADLNKLRAKVLKARLTKSPDLADLERQLEAAMASDAAPPSHSKRPETGRSGADNVVVLPRVDSHGRLRPAAEARAESEDMSIREMARIERETEGDNAMDRALAARIAKDAAFANDLDYIDENSEQLARGSTHKTSEQQRQAAIRDYRSMEAALSGCDMCFKQTEQADGAGVLRPPEYPMVALGNRVCLMLPRREPMNDGHCLIAPIEHIAGGSLRCDDDA
ncbi:Pre-mRNA-splicing factor cwf19, partial [Coemansia nantahalensis]